MDYPKDRRELGKSNIEQVHLVLLRMLNIFDAICKKHDIDYWLDYGTLLGAVRHKGFIPWDHEADVGMLRPDFENFKVNAQKDLPNDIFFQTKETDPFYKANFIVEAKLRDKYSNYNEYSSKHPEHRWHNGIQVDIFVYDFDPILENVLTNSYERFMTIGEVHLSKEELEYVEDLPFLDNVFPVPIGHDSYLKRAYGDYLQLPPKNKQIPEYVDIFKPCKHQEILYWEQRR